MPEWLSVVGESRRQAALMACVTKIELQLWIEATVDCMPHDAELFRIWKGYLTPLYLAV